MTSLSAWPARSEPALQIVVRTSVTCGVDAGIWSGHSCAVDALTLDGRFMPWQFGIGHAQLLLRARPRDGQTERLSVLFEGVQAVKLRRAYRPLHLRRTTGQAREHLLDFADVPVQHRWRFVCLTLPDEDSGFVVCGGARVLASGLEAAGSDPWWPEGARVLHVLGSGMERPRPLTPADDGEIV